MPQKTSGRCRQCGTCCKKGGPSLHLADRHLVDQGIIPASHLYTIRQGEPAFDAVVGAVIPVESDLIKIRGAGGTWACRYHDEALKICRIYVHRPVECRRLKCWDTTAIEAMYRSDRLTRQDLIGPVAGLWELVAEHQARCSYDAVRGMLAGLKQGDAGAAEKLRDMVRYDASLRQVVAERGPGTAGMTDFLFGRPMADTLKAMGVTLPGEGQPGKTG